MLVMYLLTKYLDKLSDNKFQTFYENKLMRRSRYFFIGALIYFVAAVAIITEVILYGNDSFIMGMLVFFLTAIVYGVLFIGNVIKFMGKHNSRLIHLKMGQTTSTFNKDNVVG